MDEGCTSMEAEELNQQCLELINNWGRENYVNRVSLSRCRKRQYEKLYQNLERHPSVDKAIQSGYDFFKQIDTEKVHFIWKLKQDILHCQENEDYVKVIITIKRFVKEENDTDVSNLYLELISLIRENRTYTVQEKAQIELGMLSSTSDSAVNASTSSQERRPSI